MNNKFDVIVIGAGAAGCVAAGFAAENGNSVLLLDKNAKVGRKVLITGKGRCNVTNNCDVKDFMLFVRTNPRFMYSALSSFSPADTMEFFENLGVKLKTERGNRVFPLSDKSSDITDALFKFIRRNKVDFRQECVTEILAVNNSVFGVKTKTGTYLSDNIILATGGKSYPLTGSDGSGYELARRLGHSIVSPQPSLVPIVTCEKWCADLQGLALKNVTVKLFKNGSGKPIFDELGEMLFTHFGVSGPLILSASSCIDISTITEYKLCIDMKPALDEKLLDSRILRDFDKYLNRDIQNALVDLLPQKMIPIVLELSNIQPNLKTNQITKEQRHSLLNNIKSLTIHPKSFRPIEEAIITSGGVKTTEIDPKTMQSKLVSGLYFAGEIIDVDAFTGGFNLQIAFSTGHLCGSSILRRFSDESYSY